jgi:protein-disulfide isomerase
MKKGWIAVAIAVALAGCSSPGNNGQEKSAEPKAAPAAQAEAPAAAPAAAPGTAPDKAKIGELVRRYYVGSGQIPEDIQVAVADIKPSQIGGLYEGTLKLSRGEQSQDLSFLISADGRWFVRADPVDLTVDPVEVALKKITVGPEHPSRGAKESPVTVVEYSDFQCPFCARAEQIVQEQVLKEYGDKVRFVYKQFPLTSIHPWAAAASAIGLCTFKTAGNDAYWKYHAAVFSKQKEITPENANDQLMKIAKESGADEGKVKKCVDSEEVQPTIEATLEEAEAVGVNSTPTFFVNGKRLQGAQGLEAFKGLIDPELKKAGKS